jgi:hypothetical protein
VQLKLNGSLWRGSVKDEQHCLLSSVERTLFPVGGFPTRSSGGPLCQKENCLVVGPSSMHGKWLMVCSAVQCLQRTKTKFVIGRLGMRGKPVV